MELLHHVLDVILMVGRSLRSGNTAQAAELLNLKNHLSEQQSHTGADIHTLQQEMALLQTQLRTEQRTQHLLESQGVLIAELRSQLSVGEERQEGLITQVSALEQAQAALQAESAARPSSTPYVEVPFTGQVGGVSNGVGGVVELDVNGSVVMGGEEHDPSSLQGSTGISGEDLDSLAALRSISQVGTGRIPAVKVHMVHHDNRGDYGMEEVERSSPSYLSTTTTAPSNKPPSLTGPPSTTGNFSMAAAKAGRFQQHEEVFSRLDSGMELGSPKGRRAPHVGNPLAPGLTPVASVTLPAGRELSAVSAANSSVPLLHQGEGPDDFASMGDSVAKLVDLFDYQHSADATQLEPEAWQTLAQQMKVAVLHLFPFVSSRYQNALADLEHHESCTRGLVIPCGTSDFHFALHLVAAVRHVFNSTLPIEVMYAGDSDLSADQRDALESVGTDIRSVDILHFFDEETVGLLGGGWAIKPFAVLASSFEQVIIADSDVVFLQTPEAAFSHPGYISTGTLYFHDRIVPGSDDVHTWWRNIMQDRTPSPMMAKSAFWAGNTIHEQESGVVLFNKDNRSVLIGLLYAAWMNTRRIRSEATYRRTLGDKESYWMAFELAKIPYFFDDVYASAIGHVTKSSTDQKPLLCPSHLLHLDHQGVWDGTNCMLQVEEHGGPRDMSDGGWDKVYKDTVQIATEWDAKSQGL
ncbi:hypothetical protein WJX82_009686 [Trebouxia sp. C0006]